ncbi:inhibitor of apoptosis-promoting Bax1-domain-containing protein [Gongronella butleri]|nr:inhibitor of apoptosis-promoting Bax1-domain-containing protein [Gongronella butleri]
MSDHPYNQGKSWANNTSNEQQLSRPVRRHLVNVYLTIAAMLAVAAVGAQYGGPYSPLHAVSGGVIEVGAVIGSVFGIRNMRQGDPLRWGLLLVYSLFSGISLSNLVGMYMYWDPSGRLLLGALTGAIFIFLGFSMSAVLANRRSMLYVGGMAGSLLGLMMWASLANIFFIRSSSMFSAELYIGLIAFAGFVLYDTQMIVEQASAGFTDIPRHALELFMDLFALFVRLAMIVLRRDQERDEDNRRRRERRREQRRF